MLQRISRQSLVLFGSIFLLMSGTLLLLASSDKSYPTIRSDGMGYYFYLPSAFVHQDMRMTWTEPMQQREPWDGESQWYGLTPVKDGTYIDKYPIGLAILWLPFFLAGHFLAAIGGFATDGYSLPYQMAVAAAAVVYASLAAVMLFKFLRRYFSQAVSYFVVLTLFIGTNLLSYIVYDSSFTHVYSLFLISALLYLTPQWYRKMSYKNGALLAVLLALIFLVRPTDALIVIPVLLWNISSREQLKQRAMLFWKERKRVLAIFVVGMATLFPQLVYWKYITGNWLTYSYKGEEGFNFTHPEIINILFSPDRGVFFWAPVLVLGVAGIILLRKYVKEWAWAAYAFLPVWLYIVSSWWSWQFGVSYGHRAFIDIFPFFALGLGVIFTLAQQKIHRYLLAGIVGACVFANLFLMWQYWIAALPGASTSVRIYLHVWQNEVHAAIFRDGLQSGVLGLIGIICIVGMPLTYYFLQRPRPNKRAKLRT